MADVILGSWKEESVDDPSCIPLAMGFSQEIVDGYNKTRAKMLITTIKEGNLYKSTVRIPDMPPIETSFELGVEKDTKDPTGTAGKVVFEIKDGFLVETRTSAKYKVVTTRKFTKDGKRVESVAQCGSAKSRAVWVKCD